jgi:hypothetical protein
VRYCVMYDLDELVRLEGLGEHRRDAQRLATLP